MSNVNVWLFASGTIAPGRQHHWFWDVPPWYYNAALRRVRSFSAVPFVSAFDWDSRALPLPPVPPWPNFEQRIAVTQVFHLLKATPPYPPDTYPPGGPNLQVNVIVTNLMEQTPVTYRLYMSETDN